MTIDAAETAFLRRLDHPGSRFEAKVNRYRRVDHPFHIRERLFNKHVLYYIYQHEVEMRAGGREDLLRPQSFMWIAPGVRHSLSPPDRGLGPRKVRLIHIVGHLLDRHGAVDLPHPVVVAHRCSELQAPMRMLHEQLQLSGPHAADVQRHLVATIAALAFRAARDRRDGPAHALDHEQRERLLEYVARRAPQDVHPRDLARLLRLSHDYFTRCFSASFGCSPRAWLQRERLERAAEHLVQPGCTVGEVARHAGYPDVFPFSKQFKAHFGQSPSAFRRAHEGWNEP